jgi:hypothetical protein
MSIDKISQDYFYFKTNSNILICIKRTCNEINSFLYDWIYKLYLNKSIDNMIN